MRNIEPDFTPLLEEHHPQITQVHRQHRQIGEHRIHGRLHLKFMQDRRSGHTILSSSEQRPPLRVIRAFQLADGAALVHLHNISGGVLGGDRLELEVEVGPHASAQLTTTGATRLYRHRPSMPDASQVNEIKVLENGLLEYLPDALIPFGGARYRQKTRVELDQGAGLFWWEMVAPGREARGEIFDYERLESRLEISAASRPLALERYCLEPRLRPLTSPARLGDYRYFAGFYICRAGLDAARWIEVEKELSEIARQFSRPAEIRWGVSALPRHGLVVRALSMSGRDITTGLIAFWRAAKLKLYGREAVLPRKVW